MNNTALSCPKCSGKMEPGYILDNTHGARLVSHWAAGHPQKSFWAGTKKPDEEQIPIGVFRCSTCGFLESYAQPLFAAK